MAKKYVRPKCIDFSLLPSAYALGACGGGSSPVSDNPCWNGGAPTGYDGECATGTHPTSGGLCNSVGTTPG